MERFAEQDRLEQMNAQKRRLKVAQHAREVERLIQEKREMYEAAMVSIHCTHSICFPPLSWTHCCTAGLFCYWACLAHRDANGRFHIFVCACHSNHTEYKKLIKHGTDCIILMALAHPQAAQQHSFALTAVSSQMKVYRYLHDTCVEGADLYCSHLVPAG